MLSGMFRGFFMLLDTIVYGVLEVIFQLIIDLAHFQLFTSKTIEAFRNRIYLILGLVMVFKLIVSFIQILVDPNKFDDKEQGIVGVVKRLVISMILIVIVPSIFEFSRRLQDYIIPVIPKVVLGVSADLTSESEDGSVTESSGRVLSYYSFLPFFYYYDGCENGHLSGFGDNSNATIFSVSQAASEVNLKDCPSTPDSNGYTYKYQMFISTAVGVYLVYVLVTIALKIAIRAIKFSLCEIIAPIPIASYIDPKQSKESFDKWVSTSVKVYIDLFTRLIVVYFIIYVFQLLFNSDGGSKFQETIGQYGFVRGSLVILFIIVGLLQFAKEMPKFVSDMLGMKDGFSDIGDMFKGQGWKALGTTLSGAAGLVANPISSAITNYNTARKMGEGKGIALRRAFNSGVGGVFRSGKAFVNNEGFAGTYTNAHNTSLNNVIRRVNVANDKRRERSEKREQSNAKRSMESIYYNMTGNTDFSHRMSEYQSFQSANEKLNSKIKQYDDKIADLLRQEQYYHNVGDTIRESMVTREIAKVRASKTAAETKRTANNKAINSFETDLKKAYSSFAAAGGVADYSKDWEAYNREIQHAPGTIGGTLSDAYNTFTGTPVPTSSTYSKAASLMSNADGLLKDWCVLVDKEADKVDTAIQNLAKPEFGGKVKKVKAKLEKDTTLEKALRTSPAGPAVTDVSVEHYSDLLSAYMKATSTGQRQNLTLNVTDDSGVTRTVTSDFSAADIEMLHKRMQKSAAMIVGGAIEVGALKDQKRLDAIEDLKTHINREMIVGDNDTREIATLRAQGIEQLAGKGDDLNKKYTRTATEMQGREQLKQEKKNGSGGN